MLSKSILVISDQHAPYHHIDTLDFLAAIKAKYKPDTVVNIYTLQVMNYKLRESFLKI
jgi:hypothetical protein